MKSIWNNRSIKTRILATIVLPVICIYALMLVYTLISRLDEAESTLDESGNLFANSIAKTCDYGLMTGNLDELKKNLTWVITSNSDITKIEIFNLQHELVVKAERTPVVPGQLRKYVADIKTETLPDSYFTDSSATHISGQNEDLSHIVRNIGSIEVFVSSERLIKEQKNRILIWSSIAGVCLLFAIAVGFVLARTITDPLQEIIQKLSLIQQGDYTVSINVSQGGQIGLIQTTVNEMAQSINSFKMELQSAVAAKTTDLQIERDRTIEANKIKSRLIHMLHTIAEEERKAISIEIHDELNAALIGIRLEIEQIAAIARQSEDNDKSRKIQELSASAVRKVAELYKMARLIVKRLRPETLDNLGLSESIIEMVSQYNSTHPSCKFSYLPKGDLNEIDSKTGLVIYRLIQESLSNVIKHADASECYVNLSYSKEGKLIVLSVRDNGEGIDPARLHSGIGLIGMKERVEQLKGKISIDTFPKMGSEVQITIPYLGHS